VSRNHTISIQPVGEAACLLELGKASPATTARARVLARAVLDAGWIGVYDAVPAYCTVLVRFDPAATELAELETKIEQLNRTLTFSDERQGKEIELPVHYGGEYGPDLLDVAIHSGLPPEEVVRRHAAGTYTVEFLGFSPGFPYLSGLPPELATPRLAAPRPHVPTGSVGIAGNQTGFYPLPSPGGWRLIGRIQSFAFDPARPETLPYGPGDTIRFRPITSHTADDAGSKLTLDSTWRASPQHSLPGKESPSPLSTSVASDRESVRTGLLVTRAGLQSTVQDDGRFGLASLGYATVGALDRHALGLANRLVGNKPGSACVELTVDGGEFEALGDCLIAVTGADLGPIVDDMPISLCRALWIRQGMRLSFEARRAGGRAYLAAAGGFATPLVLGSRSTDLLAGIGGVDGRALRAGDVLPVLSAVQRSPDMEAREHATAYGGSTVFGAPPRAPETLPSDAAADHPAMASDPPGTPLAGTCEPDDSGCAATPAGRETSLNVGFACEPPSVPRQDREIVLRVVWGPQADWFSSQMRDIFVQAAFTVSPRSNRTGLRLSGSPIVATRTTDLASEGGVPGVVQIPPDGQPIVLLADSRGVGGYPKLGTVIGADLSPLAHAAPGMSIRFVPTTVREALASTRDAIARIAELALRPVPELAVRCVLESRIGSDGVQWRCPRTLACTVSRRCNLMPSEPEPEQ
jgi:KipI family sensor histidine kinase inhibitor